MILLSRATWRKVRPNFKFFRRGQEPGTPVCFPPRRIRDFGDTRHNYRIPGNLSRPGKEPAVQSYFPAGSRLTSRRSEPGPFLPERMVYPNE